jgi:RNA polymerase-binding protein DksA
MPESTAKKSSAGVAAKTTAAKKKAPAKTPAKKTSATKTPSKPARATQTGESDAKQKKAAAAKRARSRKAAAHRLAVREDEAPWTATELTEVRAELEKEAERLHGELAVLEAEIAELIRDGNDGAGNDQADVGSNTLERDHEMSLATNWREMLQQVEHALERIDDGTYGVCERCGKPIGKMRLMAFPRATLCLPCKQREERR